MPEFFELNISSIAGVNLVSNLSITIKNYDNTLLYSVMYNFTCAYVKSKIIHV